jgi:hypothetical protein
MTARDRFHQAATVTSDKLAMYREQIEDVIREYGSYKHSYGDVEMEVIIDRQHDHYQLMSVGWVRSERVHGCILHIDIKDGKIWIQHDGTEEGVANRFVEAGVPKEDIVLAFQTAVHGIWDRIATGPLASAKTTSVSRRWRRSSGCRHDRQPNRRRAFGNRRLPPSLPARQTGHKLA